MKSYDYKKFDAYWQEKWQKDALYKTKNVPEKKVYVLDMFPYPSGEGLHVGHPKGYIATDIYSRFKRMNGYDVLHPMGWDAFGLPAEQYAIANKIHPRIAVEKNIATFKQQLSHIGLDYDWSREINTTDPDFYKWTQWIFTKLYGKGLAYESNEPINWCPSCKTGLANEDVEDGKCERCGSLVEKKPIRQWVLKITDYADRMLKDLDTLEWPEGVKLAQKNWIGRSEGAEINFEVVFARGQKPGSIPVFTTRPDTIYGATYMVFSPEHPWITLAIDDNHIGVLDNRDEVKQYVEDAKKKSREERIDAGKEKTGVELKGVKAINPATKEEIPIFVADYVLGGVGTGAIMAVPAHDERDYEFAKKYNLSIKQVVAEQLQQTTEPGKFNPEKETIVRDGTIAIVKHWAEEKYMVLKWKKVAWVTFPTGTVDEGMSPEDTVIKEIKEETGYHNPKIINKLAVIDGLFYHVPKGVNKLVHGHVFLMQLENGDHDEPSPEEKEMHDIDWMTLPELEKSVTPDTHILSVEFLKNGFVPFTGSGSLVNSGEFTGQNSEEVKNTIAEKFGGKKVVRYKIQDWVFARQRYWGEPFPVVRDKDGKVYMVDESELPVLLPEVESYEPTGNGESPLADIKEWVNVKGYITEKGTFKTSSDGEMFTRETNTMPQWAGSSWYYLRFADPHNEKEVISKDIEKNWLPVDVYVGGDHATRHLIYARFWHKFLYDIGVVSTIEPFSRLEFLGFILAEDGRKMSKRLGNVINPDDVIAEYGADTFRVYEMFMAPFEQTARWSTTSIKGSDKFLDRVYSLQKKISDSSSVTAELHKTIKKVTSDIENFKFNTAVSQMMILVNAMDDGSFTREDYETFIKILAPFAPHVSEQVWSELGNTSSVHVSNWPTFDPSKVIEKEVTITLQINGKLRGTFVVPFGSGDSTVLDAAKQTDGYKKYVRDAMPKKVITIPNRLINIVI
jgi:leucyl-tRNA synthetase